MIQRKRWRLLNDAEPSAGRVGLAIAGQLVVRLIQRQFDQSCIPELGHPRFMHSHTTGSNGSPVLSELRLVYRHLDVGGAVRDCTSG
jgi:hypothetical protein